MDDLDYPKIREAVNRTISISAKLNTATDIDQVRKYLSDIIGREIDESTTIFPPFYTNFAEIFPSVKIYLSTTPAAFWTREVL